MWRTASSTVDTVPKIIMRKLAPLPNHHTFRHSSFSLITLLLFTCGPRVCVCVYCLELAFDLLRMTVFRSVKERIGRVDGRAPYHSLCACIAGPGRGCDGGAPERCASHGCSDAWLWHWATGERRQFSQDAKRRPCHVAVIHADLVQASQLRFPLFIRPAWTTYLEKPRVKSAGARLSLRLPRDP